MEFLGKSPNMWKALVPMSGKIGKLTIIIVYIYNHHNVIIYPDIADIESE